MLKHIIYILILGCITCFSNNTYAQLGPGLLGKKLSVAYDFNPYLNWASPSIYTNDDVAFINKIFTYKHIFGVDYALTREFSVGADFGFSSQRLSDVEIVNSGYYLENNLSTREIGLRVKYFPIINSGGIAPVGPYLQFRLMRFSYKSELSVPNITEPFIFSFSELTRYTGSFGFGRQGILFHNILYNVGCEMAIVIPESDIFSLTGTDEELRKALLFGNLFKFKFGIAVPIF